MEEDAGVKAPVTRLRRRLSVEQSEETKSPAVNTPTKRRGRKKPELDLIDENTPENTTTRRSKKTAIKDVIAPVEEKPVTPSRRSTRIKSNTSIVSETAVAVGSPRAKRATRRASQVGSDNEAPATPVRTTRRTRKDSASSIEKGDLPIVKAPTQITEIIIEEAETTSRKSTNSAIANEQTKYVDGSRKSPRLKKKQNQSFDKTEDVVTDQSNSSQEVPIPDKIEVPEKKTVELNAPEKAEDISEAQITQKDRLSISSSNLIKDLDTKVKGKKNKINLNKSTPIVVLQNDAKIQRNRTKSWTTASEANENVFYSDNEGAKKKIKSSLVLNHSVSGDTQNISLEQNKKKKMKISNSFVVENINKSLNVENNKSKNVSKMETDIQNESKSKAVDENVDGNTSSLFEREPSGDIKTLVVIEDSDSNPAKASVQDSRDSGDQCVPVVENPDTLGINQFTLIPNIVLNKSKNRTITDNSCEPMDVDETITDSMVIAATETITQDSNRISLIGNEKEVNISNNLNSHKSKSKLSESDNLESINENKSTLILSHFKDTPVASPKIVNKLLSKSAVDLDVTQENETNKKNISLNYLTSTPLQQKSIQKLVMQVNTSIIASNADNKTGIDNIENTPKRQEKFDLLNKCDLSDKENNSMSKVVDDKMDVSAANESIKDKTSMIQKKKISLSTEQKNEKTNKDEDSDEDIPMKKPHKLKANSSKSINKNSLISSNDSDEESEISDNESRESNILDDEAEDMGDDYESGDSRDESERQFEKENEIVEKGETLTSENDLSNDSDYEKDSFIVSSEEEDNDLLDGTEDDLSMSDNELKMTSSSKKKYDQRKLKEQKMASREMYESRHKINQKSEKVKKNKRQKLSSSESDTTEPEKETEKPKKYNKMRLDSSHEASYLENDSNKNISKKKTPRLSESICDDVPNEKEITIINEIIKEEDPSSLIKKEPKTPLKDANTSIAFIDSEDTNNAKNESTRTQTELMDPLEDAMEDDVSLCSENQEIMQDYDSILNDLNKSNKTKTCDISLNLDKKSKKKAKLAIVDELNLTQVKSTKKAKNKPISEANAQKEEKVSKDSGESSDSIDIHLLFSEDSNDSVNMKNKKDNSTTEEKFIPLKRTEAKSNILEDEDSNLSLNRSAKKNKKPQIEKTSSSDTTEENNLSYFIDTEGTRGDTLNKSHNKSLKNNLSINKSKIDDSDSDSDRDKRSIPEELSIHKQKTQVIDETDSSTNKSLNKSVTKTPASAKKRGTQNSVRESVATNNSDSDAPMEVSFQKERRGSKIQNNLEVAKDETDFVLNKSLNKSLVKTPSNESKKKTNKSDLEDTANLNISTNISLIKTPKSGRKTLDQDIEQIENADNVTFIEKSFNKSIAKSPASEKKKKKKKSLSQVNDEETGHVEGSDIVSSTSTENEKKNKSISENKSLHEESNEEVSNISSIKTPKSGKKKKLSESHTEYKNEPNPDVSFTKSMTKTPITERNKKISISYVDQSEDGTLEPILNVSQIKTPGSQKKKNPEREDGTLEPILNVSQIKTPGSQKKNIPEREGILTENKENNDTNSMKRKRKSSVDNAAEVTVAEDGQISLLNESLVNNQKKKRKVSHKETTEEVIEEANKNENHMIKNNELAQSVNIPKVQKRKKRKERDDDEEDNVFKVSKQNSYEKVVPRLPTSLLKQLDDKPQLKNQQPRAKKPKLVSTTQFIVEEAKKRKAKPSNYLEESVYLNDDDECKNKKSKGRILNPKVLPFVPTASLSNSGYTTNFKVNIIPKETKFVAQSNTVGNFKDDYLYNKKIKRQGTYELYKRNRNLKISKF